ncbi:MAG TPA: hypothetical protein VJ810_42665 [Blastocatellia bacterium]|nr:hypothetical protein [Blastocatellia bacterium]
MHIPQDPTATIHFTGLMVFCFDKRLKHCQIGIHSKTDDHELRLRFIKKGPDPETKSEQTLTISHGMIRRASDLWLDVEGEPSTEQRTAEPFIVGRRDEPPADPRDFRRVVDLEGEHFYNRPLKVRRDVLGPILFVAKGLFYTATLTPDSYLAVPVASNGPDHPREGARGATGAIATGRSIGQIAEYVGANIYLTHANQALVLRAGQNGSELLRLKKEAGTTYEITIENGDTPEAPAGGDFVYYYDAIALNHGEPRILLEPYGLPSFRDRAFPPCGPVGLGKSDGLVFE